VEILSQDCVKVPFTPVTKLEWAPYWRYRRCEGVEGEMRRNTGGNQARGHLVSQRTAPAWVDVFRRERKNAGAGFPPVGRNRTVRLEMVPFVRGSVKGTERRCRGECVPDAGPDTWPVLKKRVLDTTHGGDGGEEEGKGL